eukprot:TRINITY_DN37770_c0_g1_i1.p2 TRINITY_DN37770_c0_g1~~TRINITY_DN37770_c0_g1_i1.p2  ORF type:complete len:166 (-),score=32.89 TRINITY_DN37770_c0_g1_i1:90-587(-)
MGRVALVWGLGLFLILAEAVEGEGASQPALKPTEGMTASVKWEHCDGYDLNDRFHVRDVSVDPFPPRAGRALSVLIRGDVDECVLDGRLDCSLWYRGIYHTEGPDAEEGLCSRNRCPFCEGPVTLRKQLTIPGDALPGPYTIHVEATDQDQARLTCVEAHITLHA